MELPKEWLLPPLFSQDKPFIKEYRRLISQNSNPFTRDDFIHFCVNAMVINTKKTHLLMIYHRIFDSWSFPGGHADGERDLLKVGIKETKEETGLFVRPVIEFGIGWDLLHVPEHMKKKETVKSHKHLVGTYLYIGNDKDPLFQNVEETKGVKWIPIDEWKNYTTEDHMISYYEKIIRRAFSIL